MDPRPKILNYVSKPVPARPHRREGWSPGKLVAVVWAVIAGVAVLYFILMLVLAYLGLIEL
jgi:hypothetical protein